MAAEDFIRLHITPFNPSLLSTYISTSVLPSVRNVSYHTIETFPERGYGYVDLPPVEAEKLKKKLNGTILKGTKVRIETARPEKDRAMRESAPGETKGIKKEKSKKRKRDEIPAIDIGDRQVKRGWTVPATKVGKDSRADKKAKAEKSKFTNAPECLFKTVVPPNVSSKSGASTKKEPEHTKEGKKPGKGKAAVVHEFAKSTKYATFLRTSTGSTTKKPAAEFVKGKGWVDEDGNIVEAVRGGSNATKRSSGDVGDVDDDSSSDDSSKESSDEEQPTRAELSVQPVKEVSSTKTNGPKSENAEDSDLSTSSDDSSDEEGEDTKSRSKIQQVTKNDPSSPSSDSSSDEEASDDDSDAQRQASSKLDLSKREVAAKPSLVTDSSTDSSSDSSSESESESDDASVTTPTKASTSLKPLTIEPPSNLSIKIPEVTQLESAVHPLEALFKRPKLDISTSTPSSKPSIPSFSFFGADGDNDDIEMDDKDQDEPQVPLTPYTQKDFEWRGMRSAAPTPDTAHANKRFIWPGGDEEEDEKADGHGTPVKAGKGKEKYKDDKEEKGAEETEFQKWFYEHRGEATRAWKKRRKVVAKEKRQRENRKRQDR